MKKILLVALALTIASPAFAVDLGMTFKDQDGKTLIPDTLSSEPKAKCGEREGGPCLTLGSAIFHALLQPFPDEVQPAPGTPALSGEDKFKRGALAMKIMDQKQYNFTAPELEVVKKVLGKMYSALIIVQAYRAIDPTMKDPELAPK